MRVLVLLILLGLGPVARAQSSTSYIVSDHVFSSGGTPDGPVSPTSAGYRVESSTLGEALIAGTAASAGYQVHAGYSAAYLPVGPIDGLRFVSRDGLSWSAARGAVSYSLLRDALPSATVAIGDCLIGEIAALSASDPQNPVPGSGFAYLVSGRSRLEQDGPLGNASDGTARTPATPCP